MMASRQCGAGTRTNLVFSKFHVSRPCSSCVLCGKTSTYYTHFMNWNVEEKEFVARHYKRDLADSACIYRADHLEAKHYHSDPSYLPKWKRLEQEEGGASTGTHCIYPNCLVNTKLIVSAFEPTEKLETILSVKSNHENSFVLCQQHYQELYRKVHASNPCACCGTELKFGQPFSRHSPDAETVFMHLSKTGLDVEMKPEDYICSTCYNLHLSILKGIHD